MSKSLALVAAAAMLFGATAFAQDQSGSSSKPDTASSSSSAPADTSSDNGAPKKHHKRSASRGGKGASTDHDADKLNACMSNATPTSEQEQCLKQASNS
jgi:hypothetical protein